MILMSETKHTQTYCDSGKCIVRDKYTREIIKTMSRKRFNKQMRTRILKANYGKTMTKKRNTRRKTT